jgi:hypothetical protein
LKKIFPVLALLIVILISLACSLFVSAPEVPSNLEANSTAAVSTFKSKGQMEKIAPGGPAPTALSPDSLPYSEAILDDLPMVRFIGDELALAELERPYSPFDICFEEKIFSLTVDPNSKFFSYFLPECNFSEVEDFAMSSTVVLKSTSPVAACGYLFRSGGGSTFYLLRLERAQGSSRWSLMYVGDGVIAKVLQPPAADSHLDLSEGAQTRVLLYMNGETIKVFFNSHLAGKVSDSTLPSGGIGLFVGSVSNPAVCRYDALWVNVYHAE